MAMTSMSVKAEMYTNEVMRAGNNVEMANGKLLLFRMVTNAEKQHDSDQPCRAKEKDSLQHHSDQQLKKESPLRLSDL